MSSSLNATEVAVGLILPSCVNDQSVLGKGTGTHRMRSERLRQRSDLQPAILDKALCPSVC